MSRLFRPRANTAVTAAPGRAPEVEWIGRCQPKVTGADFGTGLAHQVTATIPSEAIREWEAAREWLARWDAASGPRNPAHEAMAAYATTLGDAITPRGVTAWFLHYDS